MRVFVQFCQFLPVFAGINWHKLVFATGWHKLSLCRHFANPESISHTDSLTAPHILHSRQWLHISTSLTDPCRFPGPAKAHRLNL